eukprot:3468104-Pyramimonas_sp.AAC.1
MQNEELKYGPGQRAPTFQQVGTSSNRNRNVVATAPDPTSATNCDSWGQRASANGPTASGAAEGDRL